MKAECDKCVSQNVNVDHHDGVFIDGCGAGQDINHDGECKYFVEDEEN